MADLPNGDGVVSVLLKQVCKRRCRPRRELFLLLTESRVAVLDIGGGA